MPVPTTKKELQKSATILILGGFLLYIAVAVCLAFVESDVLRVVLIAAMVGCLIAYVLGCMRYMLSKGYAQWHGLLGLLGLIGLIIMAVIPDKWTDNVPPPQGPTNYPRYPQG